MKIEAYLCAIGCLIIAALVYIVTAFVTWDVNPGNWSTFIRFMASFFWLSGTTLVVIVVNDF